MLTTSQLPLNLVLLKNIEVSGIHWGEYMGMYSPLFENGHWRRTFIPHSVREPGHVISVFKAIIRHVLVSLLQPSGSYSSSSMLQSGKAAPVVYPEIYPLERLSDGLVALENRRTWGKAVVRVKDEPAPPAKL